jgi:isocitrate/isopropylmalate dehydrogenase
MENTIGLIRGAGTGDRLIKIFKDFLGTIAHAAGKSVAFVEDEREYHSHKSLETAANDNPDEMRTLSEQDTEALYTTMCTWQTQGIRHVFRTSINAEALYAYRKKVGAVKEFRIKGRYGSQLLILRDQVEGFYAIDDYTTTEEKITFSESYTKTHQQRIAKYAIEAGRENFGENFEVWAIYKHHLFGNRLTNWFREVGEKEHFNIQFFQPDTGFFELIDYVTNQKENPKNIVVFCSNEVGDLIHEPLIAATGIKGQYDLYSRNIYLSPPFSSIAENDIFIEYQTIHGNADDIFFDKKTKRYNKVLLPYATLRIAAAIGEAVLGVNDLRNIVDKGIALAKFKQKTTSTDRIVATVKKYTLEILKQPKNQII